jgi:Tfp pilus assembly protein PilO
MKLALDVRRNMRLAVLVGLAILLIDAGVYGFLVRPRVKSYENLAGTRAEFERELAVAEKNHKTFASYYERLVTTERNDEIFHKQILGTKQEKLIEVQKEIADIATEFGIDPESVSFDDKERDEDGLEEFGISIPIEGDYSNLRKFLARIENSKSFLIVDRIALTGTKEGGLQLQLNISMSTYFDAPWLKNQKAAGRGGRRRA